MNPGHPKAGSALQAAASDGDEVDFDVAIVGFGPSGSVAAGLLGGMGLRTFVCDRSTVVYDKPRAISMDHEILRVLQQLGIAEEVLEHAEPFTPSEFHGVDGRLIKRFTTVDPPYPLAHPPSVVFDQPSVEKVLRRHVQDLPSVKTALGTTLLGVDQDPGGVTLTLRSGDRGEPRVIRASALIGCDGASSTVRSLVGIELDDLGFDEPWLVVDVLLNESGLAKVPAVSKQYCEPSRPCSYIVGPRNHRRWEISINADEDPALVATPAGTWALLSRWLTPADATLWRQAAYRFHALVAGSWRRGRVFLAGDAAHQQPPFLGQGMCQGIRDVANLAWKLEAVLRGRAPDRLLDTYGQERKAHVTELTRRIKEIGQLVGMRDLEAAQARDARLLEGCNGVVKSVPRQNVQPALSAGLIAQQAHQAVGTLFPQPWICREDGDVRLDEMSGRGWRLMISEEAGPVFDELAKADAPGLQLLPVRTGRRGYVERDGVMRDWFHRHRCAAAIVRPDHYVYAVSVDPESAAVHLATLQEQLDTRETR